jgi:tetratricopeptide (TPR) repeat protein
MTVKKKVLCRHCQAKLHYDPDRIGNRSVIVKCPGCNAALRINCSGLLPDGEESAAAGAAAAGTAVRNTLEETGQKSTAVPESQPAPGDGPLIPEDRLAPPTPSGESLLEEYVDDTFQKFEEGEPEEWDTEWIQFADAQGAAVDESSINLDEFPASISGLHETMAGLRRAETLNLEGKTLFGKNRFAAAVEKFSQAIEINPEYVDALVNRGAAFAELGRTNDALQDFNRALRHEKRDPMIYNRRGEIYLQNNVLDEAIRDFTAALILNPLDSNAYINRGRAYTEKKMAAEAQEDFDQALRNDFNESPLNLSGHVFDEIDPDAPKDGSREEIVELRQRGEADLEKGAYEKAVEALSRAISLSPADAGSYCGRGRAYTGLNQLDKAMDDFNRGLRIDVLSASLYYWRAQVWQAKDDRENMVRDLKLSCELGHEPACLAWEELRRQSPPPEG